MEAGRSGSGRAAGWRVRRGIGVDRVREGHRGAGSALGGSGGGGPPRAGNSGKPLETVGHFRNVQEAIGNSSTLQETVGNQREGAGNCVFRPMNIGECKMA
eukprot:6656418-Alexandrium_andersonii.AAC.1